MKVRVIAEYEYEGSIPRPEQNIKTRADVNDANTMTKIQRQKYNKNNVGEGGVNIKMVKGVTNSDGRTYGAKV